MAMLTVRNISEEVHRLCVSAPLGTDIAWRLRYTRFWNQLSVLKVE